MFFGIIAFLPIILMIFIVIFFFRLKNPGGNLANIRPSRRIHYSFLMLYIALLLVATVISEAMESKNVALSPKKASHEAQNYSIYNEIINGDQINPSKIALKRTHPSDDKLIIYNSPYSTYIFIERKDVNDGVIEEIVYFPTLFTNDYDFSDRIIVKKPEWTNDTVTLQLTPFPVIEHISYHDASFLNQFSNTDIERFVNYEASASTLIIHLIIPKDLVIDASYKEQIEYIKR